MTDQSSFSPTFMAVDDQLKQVLRWLEFIFPPGRSSWSIGYKTKDYKKKEWARVECHKFKISFVFVLALPLIRYTPLHSADSQTLYNLS